MGVVAVATAAAIDALIFLSVFVNIVRFDVAM